MKIFKIRDEKEDIRKLLFFNKVGGRLQFIYYFHSPELPMPKLIKKGEVDWELLKNLERFYGIKAC